MIFDHVKPSQEDTDALDRVLGSGKYAVSYLQTFAGVDIRVRSYEQPGLQWEGSVPTGSTPDQVRDAWRALIIRIGRASSSTPPPDDVIRPRDAIDSISASTSYSNPALPDLSSDDESRRAFRSDPVETAGGSDLSGSVAPDDQGSYEPDSGSSSSSPDTGSSFDGGGGDFGGGGASGSFGGDP